MCIRDRRLDAGSAVFWEIEAGKWGGGWFGPGNGAAKLACGCLLYTSDAADERSSVDLGGRRIIKKKKIVMLGVYGVV